MVHKLVGLRICFRKFQPNHFRIVLYQYVKQYNTHLLDYTNGHPIRVKYPHHTYSGHFLFRLYLIHICHTILYKDFLVPQQLPFAF